MGRQRWHHHREGSLRAIAAQGAEALTHPVRDFMSKPLAVVPADAFIYRAIGRMSRLAIRHLGVVDEGGNVIGALSARDLLRLRASEAVSLGDEIDEAWRCRHTRRSMGQIASCCGIADCGRCQRSRHRRCDLARARRCYSAGRCHCREANERRRSWGASLRLRSSRAWVGGPRRKPAGHGPGQCPGLRRRSARGIRRCLVWKVRHPHRRHICTRSACPIARVV